MRKKAEHTPLLEPKHDEAPKAQAKDQPKSSYPCWRYHPEKGGVLVSSAEDEKKLGEGWVESPADAGLEAQVVGGHMVYRKKLG